MDSICTLDAKECSHCRAPTEEIKQVTLLLVIRCLQGFDDPGCIGGTGNGLMPDITRDARPDSAHDELDLPQVGFRWWQAQQLTDTGPENAVIWKQDVQAAHSMPDAPQSSSSDVSVSIPDDVLFFFEWARQNTAFLPRWYRPEFSEGLLGVLQSTTCMNKWLTKRL